MIRFIDLTGQIYLDDEEKSFAFFDTVTDKFCMFSGNQYWDNVEDFKNDFTGDDIDRFLRLMQHSIINKWKEPKIQLDGKELFFKENENISDVEFAISLSVFTLNNKQIKSFLAYDKLTETINYLKNK